MEAATPAPPPPPPPPPAAETYPVRFEAQLQPEYNRFLPLVKWLLAFPHYVVLLFLGIGVLVVHLIAFFAVIILGRYPRGLWDYVTGVFQWGARVAAYVFLLTDDYPPFTLGDDPSYPARLEFHYPEQTERWRPLITWLLILPYYFVASILLYVAEIVAFIAVFVILFTAKLPEGMFKLIRNPFEWSFRGQAYFYFLSTKYPPFEWDDRV
jgi:hypothetical protein